MDAGKQSVIEYVELSKTFPTSKGALFVVDDVNLAVRENEFLVLFGPGNAVKPPSSTFSPGSNSLPPVRWL